MKLNITRIVRMPGVLNKFLQAFTKKLGVFQKNYWFVIFPVRQLWILEGGHKANVSNAFLLNTNLLESSGFLKLNTLPKFNKVSFGGRNLRAHTLEGIRCEKDKMHRNVTKTMV